MKININKLFGKYKVSFDLDKRVTIYIGDNGIGKTTAMKIINCILNRNFVEILKYDFESLDFITEDKTFKVKYENLIVRYETILDRISQKNTIDDMSYGFLYDPNYDMQNNRNEYFKRVKEIFTKNDTMDDWSESSYINDCYKLFLDILKEELYSINILYSPVQHYDLSNFSNMEELKQLLDNKLKNKCFYVSMAKEYSYINNLSSCYVLNEIEQAYYVETNSKRWTHIPIRQENPKEYIEKIKILQRNYRKYAYFDEDKEDDINKIVNEKVIDCSKILFYKSCTYDIVKEFEDIYYDFLYNKAIFYNEYECDFFDTVVFLNNEKERYIYEYYLKPLIPKEGLFYKMKPESKKEFLYIFKEKLYRKIEEKLDDINKYFSKYITNKKVLATPRGIVILLDENIYVNQLKFDLLSEGEKKIINLFVMQLFFDNVDICLDEPENSLNIVWQKELINDLKNIRSNNRIIVCTQSPFIVNDKLVDYIIPLPMEEE